MLVCIDGIGILIRITAEAEAVAGSRGLHESQDSQASLFSLIAEYWRMTSTSGQPACAVSLAAAALSSRFPSHNRFGANSASSVGRCKAYDVLKKKLVSVSLGQP